jgi:hypothetical protein
MQLGKHCSRLLSGIGTWRSNYTTSIRSDEMKRFEFVSISPHILDISAQIPHIRAISFFLSFTFPLRPTPSFTNSSRLHFVVLMSSKNRQFAQISWGSHPSQRPSFVYIVVLVYPLRALPRRGTRNPTSTLGQIRPGHVPSPDGG